MEQEKPHPIQCPVCKEVFEWELDEDGDWWPGHAEWWHHKELGIAFLCSRRCWLKVDKQRST